MREGIDPFLGLKASCPSREAERVSQRTAASLLRARPRGRPKELRARRTTPACRGRGDPADIGDSGLYYYYHTFAKALNVMGESVVQDETGQKHDWRSELLHELVRRQRPDGSWINANSRWLEGDATLVTGYALLSLSYCRPRVERAK